MLYSGNSCSLSLDSFLRFVRKANRCYGGSGDGYAGSYVRSLSFIFTVTFSLFFTTINAQADFEEGVRLFNNGEHSRALEKWRESAWVYDDWRAQVRLGEYYDDGLHVKRDTIEAYVWYFMALINQTQSGGFVGFADAKTEKLNEVAVGMDRLAFPMTSDERNDAYRRIVYILSSRGAQGFALLAELHQDDLALEYCKRLATNTVWREAFAVPYQNYFLPNVNYPYMWVFCEIPHEIESFNVVQKNHTDAVAFYMVASSLGSLESQSKLVHYEGVIKRIASNRQFKLLSELDTKYQDWARDPKKNIEFRKDPRNPFQERPKKDSGDADLPDYYERVLAAAQQKADNWLPPFEFYPAPHTDYFYYRTQIEDEAALRRIKELKFSAIQEALAFYGHYEGVYDGQFGPGTERAIKTYQASIAEEITGQLTPKQTIRLIQKVAVDGYAPLQNTLGTMYFQGIGIQRDYRRARLWFERAARQRHPISLTNLGVIYRDSLGVDNDDEKAAQYFKSALNVLRSHGLEKSVEYKLVKDECGKLVGEHRCVKPKN